MASLAKFPADHLAVLDKRARAVPWGRILKPGVAVRVEASTKHSRIYHTGAVAERIARAIAEEFGAPVADDAGVVIRARFENDICMLGVDTSGELLHKRGLKTEVNAAPLRETLAAMFLRQCGYCGREPVLDPMCGSGTFVIEAAEMAAGLLPGRARAFAFEHLATFDAAAWQEMLRKTGRPRVPLNRFFGSDRDARAITMSRANAERSGIASFTQFETCNVSQLVRPEGPPGLVIVNPPYGERLDDPKRLNPLYRALGGTLKARFSGWRVGLVTSDKRLAMATGLAFLSPGAPVAHGGLKVTLYRTAPLP